MRENRQILIESLPQHQLQESNYKLVRTTVPDPGDGDVLCRTLAVAIAAGTRAGLQGSARYAGAPQTGVVMVGSGVARVEQSNDASFAQGDLVVCRSGWQDYSVHSASALTPVAEGVDPAHYLGALGINGLTAYFGLLEVGRPVAGETVLVSAAAGSVGHLVGQIAKLKGCVTIGITRSDVKCRALTEQIGYDRSVCYRSPGFRAELKAACPAGVDVYFDNTGGDILGNALFRMNTHGRIACCGAVSLYDTSWPAAGPKGIPGLLVNKRIRMEGFLIFDFSDRYAAARAEIRDWIESGALTPLQDEFSGLESAPRAFVDLLAGGNLGTRVVRVAD